MSTGNQNYGDINLCFQISTRPRCRSQSLVNGNIDPGTQTNLFFSKLLEINKRQKESTKSRESPGARINNKD